jgi:hypothetical protein
MKSFNASNRRFLLVAIFLLLLSSVWAAWGLMRFMHYRAQYRSLDPEHYQVQVLTAEDYRRLADPANRVVRLSDGSTIRKATSWDSVVLPKYKPANDGDFFVLVTTTGTAHILPYVRGYFGVFSFLAACGVAVGVWNILSPPDRQTSAR